jgi:hypothetical protein
MGAGGGDALADVFISYSRLDAERVKPIAERLASLGYSVWWDRTLRDSDDYVDEMERQLDASRVVLAIWSHAARSSTWVHAEASRALDARKLVQLRLDNALPPLPFDALPLSDMSGGKSEWGPLEHALTRIVRDGAPPEPVRPLPGIGALATPTAAGSPKTLTIALATTLAAFAGAVMATFNGAMSAEQLQIALVGMIGVAGACAAISAHRIVSVKRAGG